MTPDAAEPEASGTVADAEVAGSGGLQFPGIAAPDGSARAATLALAGADDTVRSPAGPLGLGRLAAAAAWLAGCQGGCPPRPIRRARVVVFPAEHGIASRGVSARMSGGTAALVAELSAGSSPLAVLAEAAGAGVRVADAGPVSRAIDTQDALTAEELQAAVRVGMAAADAEVDSGADVLVAANLGVGSTTAAATVVAALTGSEPVAVVGRGSGIDDGGWMRKTAAVRDALRRAKPHIAEPLGLLQAVGGADLAALAGFLAQAAVRRTPVLLGGLTVTAAAVVAEELAPGARDWWTAGSSTTEPAHVLALEHLDLEPLLDLQLGGDAEVAGVLALPLLAGAARVLGSAG